MAGAINSSDPSSIFFKPLLPSVTATSNQASGTRAGASASCNALTLNVPEIKACCHNQTLFCAVTVMAFTVVP